MPSWQSFVIYAFLPYFLGVGITYWFPDQANASTELFLPWLSWHKVSLQQHNSPVEESWHMSCYQQFINVVGVIPANNTASVALHPNGEAQPCSVISVDNLLKETRALQAFRTFDNCPDWNSSYVMDSFLTRLLHETLGSACSRSKDEHQSRGFYGFCDKGLKQTPILYDHHQLIPNTIEEDGTRYLPCHFHNASGYRLSSLSLLQEWIQSVPCVQDSDQVQDETCTARSSFELYAVPAGRHFMFAPKYVNEIIPLPHVTGGDPTKPVYLHVLSVSPRVFDLVNFFTKQESEDLVQSALAETSELHRIQRSTTGSNGKKVNRFRTSESGFVTSGETAMYIKRRSFDVLGMSSYIESYADGLQILRYQNVTAYHKHMDWIEPSSTLEHDYDSVGQGSNRFATLLLYMSDLEPNQGGETVFAKAWPNDVAEGDRLTVEQAKDQFLESELAELLTPGSWEEDLASWCRSRLAVRPNSARTVLFYSQLPDGQEDKSSLHAACPVFNTTKYAANLWVWNAARNGYPDSPKNPKYKKPPQATPIEATFINTGTDPAMENAELFYKDTSWGPLRPDAPITVKTFHAHYWKVVVEGRQVRRFKIATGPEKQEFII